MIPVRDHLKRYGREIIVPTERMVRHWFDRLNDEVFEGALSRPSVVVMKNHPNWMAAFERYLDGSGYALHFGPNPMSRAAFLEILAHEMVHAAVAYLDGDTRAWHGPPFMAYAPLLASRAGLPLRDAFYGEPEEL